MPELEELMIIQMGICEEKSSHFLSCYCQKFYKILEKDWNFLLFRDYIHVFTTLIEKKIQDNLQWTCTKSLTELPLSVVLGGKCSFMGMGWGWGEERITELITEKKGQ